MRHICRICLLSEFQLIFSHLSNLIIQFNIPIKSQFTKTRRSRVVSAETQPTGCNVTGHVSLMQRHRSRVTHDPHPPPPPPPSQQQCHVTLAPAPPCFG